MRTRFGHDIGADGATCCSSSDGSAMSGGTYALTASALRRCVADNTLLAGTSAAPAHARDDTVVSDSSEQRHSWACIDDTENARQHRQLAASKQR
jgi:hypothetical protein